MTKEQLWKIYVDKNPKFLTDGANLSVAGLRKFFDQTWDAGHAQGLKNGMTLGNDKSKTHKPKTDYAVPDFLSGLFSKKPK